MEQTEKQHHVMRNRIIVTICFLAFAGVICFMLLRKPANVADSESVETPKETEVVVESSVTKVSDSTSAYTEYSDGQSVISADATTLESASEYVEIQHDTSEAFQLSVMSFNDMDARMSLYGDGIKYVFSITGSVTNIGTVDGGWNSLPVIVVNGVTLDCELVTEPLRAKGSSRYRYQALFTELPESFTVSVNGATATENHYDAVAENAKAGHTSLSELMDNMDPAYIGATLFDGGETDDATLAKALAHECAVMDYGSCSSAVVYAKGVRDGGVYTVINPKFSFDNGGGTFSCQLRNNLYSTTADVVSFTLIIFDGEDFGGVYNVDSEHPLAPGEILDVSVYVEGISQNATWGMNDVKGF